MKHNWEYKRLGDVAPSMPYNGIITPNNGKYWCLNLDKIEPNTGAILKYDFIEESKLNDSVHKFTIGNVLFSKLRPNLNKVIVPDHKGYCTTELVPLLPKSILNKYFLAYYLRSPRFVNFLIGKTGGAKMPRVKMDIFWNSSIPVPPREEQERIVAELDKINEVIDDCRELLRNLDTLAQSIFYDFFGDPITNPKGWDVSKVSDNFETGSGGTPSKSNSEFWNSNDIPWIGSNMCQNIVLHKTDGKFISNLGLQNSSAKLLYPDTLLIALVGATIGKVALLKVSTSTNQNIGFIKPNKNIANPIFLFYALQGLYTLFLSIGNEKFKMANLSFIRDLPIILPPLTLQEKFAERIERIDEQKKAVEQTIAELKTLLDSRMDYWFN